MQCIFDIMKHIARMFTSILKDYKYLLDFITHIGRWFTLIFIPYTMSLGFPDAYRRVVYFVSNRSYNVTWISRSILQEGLL